MCTFLGGKKVKTRVDKMENTGYVVLGCLLHREGSTGQFAGVRVQEGKLQTAQCGQADLVLDADYFHQFLLLSTTNKRTNNENENN